MGQITEMLRQRASARAFQDRPVPQPVLDDILEAGRLSPSGGNEQPWRFGVLSEPGLIRQAAQLASGQEWIATAPLLIALCTVFVEDARGGRDIQIQRFPEFASQIAGLDAPLYWALNQEEHQTKIAGTHMLLAAQEHGLGGCWVSRFEVGRMAELLGLPGGILPSELLVLGYPEQPPRPRPRKELSEIVFINSWRKRS